MTKGDIDVRRCSQCDQPESEIGLLLILLPPIITGTPQLLCPPCLKSCINNSKKGKAMQ